MKIIFNSDLLFATYLVANRLPTAIFEFLQTCGQEGHEICIPETTLLEFNRKQAEFVAQEIRDLNRARNLLDKYGVRFDPFDSSALITNPDLCALIQYAGVNCTIVQPSLDDFRTAHRKACSREAPHPPDIKSDEMRDLVIWEIALRIASAENCAILMSRDELHTHHRGDLEASDCGLIRCESFERAYESLSIETESGRIIRQLIASVLGDLIAGDDLPLHDGAQLISIKRPVFFDTEIGTTIVSAESTFTTGIGTGLTATIMIEFAGTSVFSIKFEDAKEDDNDIESFSRKISERDISTTEIVERKRDLSELIGD